LPENIPFEDLSEKLQKMFDLFKNLASPEVTLPLLAYVF
jgi:hypothetical protein